MVSSPLRALVGGEEAEAPPVLLWKHFRLDDPWALARRTVEFQRRHRLAAAKLMPDIPLLFPDFSLSSFEQISQLRRLAPARGLGRVPDYLRAVELTRRLLEPADVLLVTLFSPLGLVGLWSGPPGLRQLEAAPRALAHRVLWALGEFCSDVAAAVLEAGADGVYYSCWGQDVLSPESYSELGVPYDLAGLAGAAGAEFRLLHVHGALDRDWGRYAAYPVQLVGWSEQASRLRLEGAGAELPGKLLMGGIEEAWGEGSPERARARALELRAHFGSRFLLAPGCSLPDDTSDDDLELMRGLAGD